LAALAPDSVSPLAVTVFPAPTVADANVALPAHVTTSPPITPVSTQLVSVALGEPSYALFAAVTAAVNVVAVMFAVVDAVVVDSM
jgi:hypothetical protein